MTSAGNRKPEKADRGGSTYPGREEDFTEQSCLDPAQSTQHCRCEFGRRRSGQPTWLGQITSRR
jgi:hypothetical protein